jgi:hypothetical protein
MRISQVPMAADFLRFVGGIKNERYLNRALYFIHHLADIP